MVSFPPRTRLIACLVLAGIGLALFFGGEYRDFPLLSSGFPVGWLGTCLFVAAVWSCVGLIHRVPHSPNERLREFSYPYIAQLLMQALLWGLWFEQFAAAVLYWRDRRATA